MPARRNTRDFGQCGRAFLEGARAEYEKMLHEALDRFQFNPFFHEDIACTIDDAMEGLRQALPIYLSDVNSAEEAKRLGETIVKRDLHGNFRWGWEYKILEAGMSEAAKVHCPGQYKWFIMPLRDPESHELMRIRRKLKAQYEEGEFVPDLLRCLEEEGLRDDVQIKQLKQQVDELQTTIRELQEKLDQASRVDKA